MAERRKRCGSPVLKDKVYGVRCPGGCHLDNPDSAAQPPPPSPRRTRQRGQDSDSAGQDSSASTRGGRRIGAGRKPAGEPGQTVSAHLPPALLQRLDAYADANALSRSGAVARLLDEGLPATT